MDGRKLGKSLNVVHNDEIWKDHINRELIAQKHWPQKWGFLSDIYKELRSEEKPNSTNDDTKKSEPKIRKSKFPATDSNMIGWKSALTKQNPYGIPEGRARGRCDILRTFNWPQESQ